jgi:hypothetical protein
MFRRLLRPPSTASTRAYSVFSSKSGGGRYFNSSKPPNKIVAPANRPDVPKTDASSASSDIADQQQQQQQQPIVPSALGAPDLPHVLQSSSSSSPSDSPTHIGLASLFSAPAYPPLNPIDLRLHQFFSLHRPLHLHQPSSSLFQRAETLALGPTPEPVPEATAKPLLLDDPPETTPEADADAARQLARALALQHIGAAASWDETLRRIGIDPTQGLEDPPPSFNILLDSVKRKRKSKMKKHKFVLYTMYLTLCEC